MTSQTNWQHFVEHRRRELHEIYPCAMPTSRRVCPKHGIHVPQDRRIPEAWVEHPAGTWRRVRAQTIRLSGTCKPCRDELYAQLVAEYPNRKEEMMETNTPGEMPAQLVVDEVDVIDAEVHGALAVPETSTAAPITLFGTGDPDVALARMQRVADALLDVVRSQKLVVRIGGREHLTAEAWTTLGGMLGIVPIVAWTRPLEDGSGWEARVEARTISGALVGAAESMCSRSESTWAKRDEFALRAMSQTRAISRALRAPLGQIVRLAGYEPAGAEEMPAEAEPAPSAPTHEQKKRLKELLAALREHDPERDWQAWSRDYVGVESFTDLDHAAAVRLITGLELMLKRNAA